MRVFQRPPSRAKQLTPSLVARSSATRSGCSAATCSRRIELDDTVSGADLVAARPASRSARRRPPRGSPASFGRRFPLGNRLLHLPEHDLRTVTGQLDGNHPGLGLEPDHDLLQRPPRTNALPASMTGERQLPPGREDPDPDVGLGGDGGRTKTVSLSSSPGDVLHCRRVEVAPSVKTASWLPVSGRVGEDVRKDVAISAIAETYPLCTACPVAENRRCTLDTTP